MAVPFSIVGTVFNAAQISLGTIVGTGPFTFTETTSLASALVGGILLGTNAQVTVTNLTTNPGTGVQTFTGTISGSTLGLADGQTITGAITGNDASDFLINGTVAGLPTSVFITNVAALQPGSGNTVTVQPPSANITFTPACYCLGTLIRTECGEVAVEKLQIGDRVLTINGHLKPIRWIGTRSYGGRFLAGHDYLLPIRIRAGALGDGLPVRDLLVSPKHAMLLDGVLVAAELLVNGTTIVKEHGLTRVDYVHVELAEHDVIWAEGALSETFIDDESRDMFNNADTFAQLYPGMQTPVLYCAPRVIDGFKLYAIRARLNDQAGASWLGSTSRSSNRSTVASMLSKPFAFLA